MKRTTLIVLVLFLAAYPAFAAASDRNHSAAMHCVSLEHVSGGWRMQVACDHGKGSILVTDSVVSRYKGDGMFAGWSQEQMRSLYESLIPKDNFRFELLQLG